jgi:rhomboid protease GluP
MRKRTGSVVCPSCGSLVGVNDEKCYNCGRRNPSLWGFAPLLRHLEDIPFADVVIATCAMLYLAMLLVSGGNIAMNGIMDMLGPSPNALMIFGASGAAPIFLDGRWWTPLSATFLHANILHILFNMMWVRDLSPTVAHLYGSSRAIIIFTVSGVIGFLTSSFVAVFLPFLGGAGLVVGASASIFGLLGAMIYYQRRAPSRLIGFSAAGWAVAMLVFGFIMPDVDNWAHMGGLASGFLASMWMDPLKPEGQGHMIAAVLCLVASALAIIASIVIPYR